MKERIVLAYPQILLSRVREFSFQLPIKKLILFYAAYVAETLVAALLFDLKLPFIGILLFVGMFSLPELVYLHYKKLYEHRRFTEAAQYLEQLLYAFKETGKLLKSLISLEPLFQDGPMSKAIRDAKTILIEEQSEAHALLALKSIEKKYPSEKIYMIHRFLLKAEAIGGDYGRSIALLQQERSMWVERVLSLQKEREAKRTNVLFSILASVLLCAVMDRLLPADVHLTGTWIAQTAATMMLLADLWLFLRAQREISIDYLMPEKMLDDETILKYQEYIERYEGVNAVKKALPGLLLALVFAVGGIILNSRLLLLIAAVLAPIILCKPALRYRSYMNTLKKMVRISFPHWLMEVALILKDNTVRNAIRFSYAGAPQILKPDLKKLIEAFEEDPISAAPYLSFAKTYEVQEITVSMKMLYAVSAGTGTDPQLQIEEIVQRNNTMLDQAQRMINEDSLSGLYAMFMAPQLVSGAKILLDMCLFFVVFFTKFRL